LSSDHLLSGVNADYKKAGSASTARTWSAETGKFSVPSSQFSVKNAGVTENWELRTALRGYTYFGE
jgi:hypothetical protein